MFDVPGLAERGLGRGDEINARVEVLELRGFAEAIADQRRIISGLFHLLTLRETRRMLPIRFFTAFVVSSLSSPYSRGIRRGLRPGLFIARGVSHTKWPSDL